MSRVTIIKLLSLGFCHMKDKEIKKGKINYFWKNNKVRKKERKKTENRTKENGTR